MVGVIQFSYNNTFIVNAKISVLYQFFVAIFRFHSFLGVKEMHLLMQPHLSCCDNHANTVMLCNAFLFSPTVTPFDLSSTIL